MLYLETSKDILNLSLAISIFGIAFLLGWILVYFIVIIRRLVSILSGVEESLKKVEDFMTAAREKLDHSTSYLSMLAMGAKELVSYFMSKQTTSRSNSKKKSNG